MSFVHGEKATATIIDFYRRYVVTAAPDEHYVRVSRIATVLWGLFACIVAMQAAGQGSLIEVVNRYGSFVYGSLLGVFMLAILVKRATALGAFIGLIAGMATVLTVAAATSSAQPSTYAFSASTKSTGRFFSSGSASVPCT